MKLQDDIDEITSYLYLKPLLTNAFATDAGILSSWLCEVLAFLAAKVFIDNFASGFVSNVAGLKDVSRNHTLTLYDGPIDVVMHLTS